MHKRKIELEINAHEHAKETCRVMMPKQLCTPEAQVLHWSRGIPLGDCTPTLKMLECIQDESQKYILQQRP